MWQGSEGIGRAAFTLGTLAKEKDIQISLHAPYYISLSSVEEEKRIKSADYILQSAMAVKKMGGNRIVVHCGSASKISRQEALLLSQNTLKLAQKTLDEQGFSDIIICIETMGKLNQLGNLTEVLTLCKIDERMLPCIDFGHLNARTNGGLATKSDFTKLFEEMENMIGYDRLKIFHSHFSKIEYTEKGGEKKHLTFADKIYGPSFEHIAEITAKKNLTPVFICESAGTQAEDAVTMKNIYLKYK